MVEGGKIVLSLDRQYNVSEGGPFLREERDAGRTLCPGPERRQRRKEQRPHQEVEAGLSGDGRRPRLQGVELTGRL